MIFGVKVFDGKWIVDDCQGLIICDVIFVVFVMELFWKKFDVVIFFWQKVLGGEGVYGMLILSLRVVEWFESYILVWLLLKIFCMIKGGKLIEGFFCGEIINILFMLCVVDYLDVLSWVCGLGGVSVVIDCFVVNMVVVENFVD